MGDGNCLRNRQSQPRAIADRIIGAIKALEHQIHLVRCNPTPLIDALDDAIGAIQCIGELDGLLWLAMANSVFEDI